MSTRIYAVFSVVLALACGSTTKSAPAATPARAGDGATRGMCPMNVPGTHVSVEDTKDGVALAFTTSGDVGALRDRVRAMAARHEQHAAHGMMMMPASNAHAEDIPQGARLVLVPRDPAQLAALRDHVHHHAGMMAGGHCPMMGHA